MITIYSGKPKQEIQGERVQVITCDLANLFDMIQTPSMFGERKNFILMDVFENEEIKKEIIDRLKLLKNTPHDVTIMADSIKSSDAKILEKIASIHITEPIRSKESTYNPFGFGTLFALGDKKKTWIAFLELVTHEDEMEKTHGLIWWKLKDMIQKKSVFSKEQLVAMARNLVSVYHESRLGGLEMRDRLEKFFLTLPEIKK